MLALFIIQSSIILHVGLYLNKPFIYSFCNSVLHICKTANMSYYCRRESLAVAKTEETGLREMEKSKTNTEMYPG